MKSTKIDFPCTYKIYKIPLFYLVVAIMTNVMSMSPGVFWKSLRGRGGGREAGQQLVGGRRGRGGDGGAGAGARAEPVLATPIALSCVR